MNRWLNAVVRAYNDNFSSDNKVVWEVGSRDGIDGFEVALRIGATDPSNLYFVEANPNQSAKIKELFPDSHVFDIAVSNFEGAAEFAVFGRNNGIDMGTVGCSSLNTHWLDNDMSLDPTITKEIIEVRVTKLANLVEESGVQAIDVMLIDVEGLSYEVLQGLGEHINKVKVIELETEVNSSTDQVVAYLTNRGFELYERVDRWTGFPDLVFINKGK